MVWTHFLGAFTLSVLSGMGIYTNAYFFDNERGAENMLATTYLDGEAGGEVFDDAVCVAGSDVARELLLTNIGALPFHYDAAATDAAGGACGHLQTTVFLNAAEVYDGPLVDFAYTGASLEPGAADTWRMHVRFPEDVFPGDPTCAFATVFQAHQENFASGQAFYDQERLEHSIIVEPGSSVTVTNTNTSTVTNSVVVSSQTGSSSESGTDGEEGEDGEAADGSSGGDGGDGGSGGGGGTSTTSSSTTRTSVRTEANVNETDIEDDCGCVDVEGSDAASSSETEEAIENEQTATSSAETS